MGGGAKAVEAYTVTGFNAGHAQAAEADDSGAEEWGGMDVIQVCGQWEDEIVVRLGVLGVAAVDGVAGEGGGVAEIFLTSLAVGADAIGAADPGDADAGAERQFWRCAIDDVAYDLVARDHVGF